MAQPHQILPIFLRPSDVQRLLGIGKTKLWELSQQADFPPKVRITPGCVGYWRHEIERWAEARPRVGPDAPSPPPPDAPGPRP